MKNFSLFKSQFSISRGFTLIELLVVIVIISVLATLLMVNFVGVRQRGRDTKRKSDLEYIRTQLEVYRADNGSYPLTANFPACEGELYTGTVPNKVTYIAKVACDPQSTSTNKISYSYASSDGVTYTLRACLENSNDKDRESPTVGCSVASFLVTQP